MNVMQKIGFSFLMLFTGVVFAGNQGVSAYFGFGLGGSSVTDSSLDIAPTGVFFAGIEEDGWALEYAAFKSTETGSDDPTVDYTVSGSQSSLSYRSIENGGMYYKIKFGTSDFDVEYKGNVLPEVVTSGQVWGLGIGFRTARDERLEIEYGFYSPDENTLNEVHMLMFSYLFGGPISNRK